MRLARIHRTAQLPPFANAERLRMITRLHDPFPFSHRSSCTRFATGLAAASLQPADPEEIASLRQKAERGNAVAQYNLGLIGPR